MTDHRDRGIKIDFLVPDLRGEAEGGIITHQQRDSRGGGIVLPATVTWSRLRE